MIILAFLQNQWFKDPDGVRAMYQEHPERRNRYIQAFLFMGCLTGRRIKAAFGEALCNQIIWEEASPEVGGQAYSSFPADPKHIAKVIVENKPNLVLSFGKIASDGLANVFEQELAWKVNTSVQEINFKSDLLGLDLKIITGPHPANRDSKTPTNLSEMANKVFEAIHDYNVQTLV